MRIWEFVGSTADAVKRNLPDATPVKDACINSCTYGTAALTTIAAPVKSACQNTYKRGSAKIDQCVRITGLRRVPPRAAEGVDKINVATVKSSRTSSCANGTASFTKMGQAGQTSGKSVFTYGFMTFVKIGYTVRVKGFYRVVHWIANDGTKSVTCVYTTNIAQNAELYESKYGDELNIGQAVEVPVINECRTFTHVFLTFAKIGYFVRVNCFYSICQWMADDDTKYRIRIFTTKFAENVCLFALQDGYNLIPGGLAIYTILSNTFNDVKHETQKPWKEKAGSNNGHGFSSGAHESLKDEAGFPVMKELLVSIMIEFTALMRAEPFRTQFHKNGVTTKESLLFMMREFCVFMMKQVLGSQFSRQTKEAVVVIMSLLFSTEFCKDMGLNEPETKGNKKKNKNKGK